MPFNNSSPRFQSNQPSPQINTNKTALNNASQFFFNIWPTQHGCCWLRNLHQVQELQDTKEELPRIEINL